MNVDDEEFFYDQVPNMKEILLIGFYQPNEELNRFLSSAQQEFKIPVRSVRAAVTADPKKYKYVIAHFLK